MEFLSTRQMSEGKLGFPAREKFGRFTRSCCGASDRAMKTAVLQVHGRFRAVLRVIQGFLVCLLELYGFLQSLGSIINRGTGEFDKGEYTTADSPSNSAVSGIISLFSAPDVQLRSPISDLGMKILDHEFRGGFRSALRILQGFFLILLTMYKKFRGLLTISPLIIDGSTGESDMGDTGTADSPSSSLIPASIEHVQSADLDNSEKDKFSYQSPTEESQESLDRHDRENWVGKYSEGNRDPCQDLHATVEIHEFNKSDKVDAELNKELEQRIETRRTVLSKLHEEKFATSFFEANDNNDVDSHELKAGLEHVLEKKALISDTTSSELPSQITDHLFIGGALAARSIYTLQHVGVTHILCLCSDDIGQSDSQHPNLFRYKNFSVSDNVDVDIADIFEEACNFIDNVECLGGKVLVHCFEGKSRSATIILAYLLLRKRLNLLQAWNLLKEVHPRAQPNDGFAKILLELDKRLYGKSSMEWQQKRPIMKICPICGKNAGFSSRSLKLHMQKSHKKTSLGSVDSAMTLEKQKAPDAVKIFPSSNVKPTKKQ